MRTTMRLANTSVAFVHFKFVPLLDEKDDESQREGAQFEDQDQELSP